MLAIATAALLVFSVSAQAAKYDYGYKGAYYGRDAYSEVPSYTYEPTYKQSHEHRYRRDVREGNQQLGDCLRLCDTLSLGDLEAAECTVECVKIRQGNIFTDREAQQFPSCKGLCTDEGPTGPYPPCRDRSAAAGNRHFCYVSELCKDAKRSVINPDFIWSIFACCGNKPCGAGQGPEESGGILEI